MPWYWPFKRKHTPARNGGTVAATVHHDPDVAENNQRRIDAYLRATDPPNRVDPAADEVIREQAAHYRSSQSVWNPAPATVEEHVAKQREHVGALAALTKTDPILLANPERVRLMPVEHRFAVGERVVTVNGQHVWTVTEVASDGSSVLVNMRDSRGRLQAKRYHPERLAPTERYI